MLRCFARPTPRAFVRHVVGDRRAGPGGGPLSDPDRRHQHGVTADEGAIADVGWMLRRAVVVAGNDPGTDVGAITDRRVSEIGEMASLGAGAELCFLQLDKVSDFRALQQDRCRAQSGEWPDGASGGDLGTIEDAVGLDDNPRCELGVANPSSLVQHATLADVSVAEKRHSRVNNRLGSDTHLGLDRGSRWLEDRNPGGHQLTHMAVEQGAVDLRQLAAIIDAEGLCGVFKVDRADGLSGRGRPRPRASVR